MLNLLKILLAEQREKFEAMADSFKRRLHFPATPKKIKVAMGMRRVGKTYFLFQEIRRLQEEENIPWERMLCLNFEDDRLLPCSQENLRNLLESFYKLYPENHHQICYLFLDEIQNVEGWSLVIRRFLDTKKVDIYLSGSSAKLLSTEIATELRGRSIATEIWPYSFEEYLLVKKMNIPDIFGQIAQDTFHHTLRNYLYHGGFPEISDLPIIESRQILQDYVELVIMRDVVERHDIKNIAIIKYMIKTLLKNSGASFSVNKFFNDIKSQGMPGSRSLLYDYLGYLEDAYLLFSVPLFSESLKKIQANPKKMYSIDPGLVKAYTFSLNDNYGHLFENLVFLDFKRRGHKIHYYLTPEKYEVDFLIEDKAGQRKLYQVVWDSSNSKTLEREKRALETAKEILHLEGELITPESYLEKTWENLHSQWI